MIKRNLIISVVLLGSLVVVNAQEKKQEPGLKREVTLYNPYKPTLPSATKRSFLPDMNDTVRVRNDFRYAVNTKPFFPAYTISPIKAGTLSPDPLLKLYKSFINIGMGNYITPLAEISITNERSKKGTLGFYGRHLSSSGKIKLQNDKNVFAGYMDNEASLFGRKFFRRNLLEGSVDFSQKTRYAYGYDTSLIYSPEKKNILVGFNNLGAKASFSSINLDSTSFTYDFDLYYNFFYNAKNNYQHSAGFTGVMAKEYREFYVGSGLSYDYYRLSDFLLTDPKFTAALSPFIRKSNEQWNFQLGFKAVLNKNMTVTPEFHMYPDINFGFSVVPAYINFFAGLSGKLEKNDPNKIIGENPYLVHDGTLFKLPDTDHQLIVFTGLKGNTGGNGNYELSVNYSLIRNMLFYSNIVFPDKLFLPEMGNDFIPLTDDVDLLNFHGELSGRITDKISYNANANYYKYTLSANDYAWNKPSWDGQLTVKYNLRNKIIAGIELTGIGKRYGVVTDSRIGKPTITRSYPLADHFNLNLNLEYRYTNILSFWTRFNNLSYNRYYEWVYYPTQRFLFMAGFTYSL